TSNTDDNLSACTSSPSPVLTSISSAIPIPSSSSNSNDYDVISTKPEDFPFNFGATAEELHSQCMNGRRGFISPGKPPNHTSRPVARPRTSYNNNSSFGPHGSSTFKKTGVSTFKHNDTKRYCRRFRCGFRVLIRHDNLA
ncbi:5211_t:CDS:2, partial [Acaulospora morrowiae]